MLYIAADHAGYKLKKSIIEFLTTKLKIEIEDLGAKEYDKDDDFVDFAKLLATKLSTDSKSQGILICGSGNGMCIAANKIKNIKAVLGYSIQGAELSRKHNDANIICLAGRVLSSDHAVAIVRKFLETNFDGGARFVRRNKKIDEL